MFLMNVESLMPVVQNLCSEVKLFLLSAETLPVLLISNAVTVVLMCVMSVEKCAYLFVLSMFRCEMLVIGENGIHTLTHSGERSHICIECEKSIQAGSDLRFYLLIHTGKKPNQLPDPNQEHALRHK